MPDTAENQLAFPQLKTVTQGVGFPIMRAVALISLATGAVIDFACAKHEGKGTGEGSLLRGMLDTLKFGDVLVADRYYPSYFTVAACLNRGIDMVSVSHSQRMVNFDDGDRLGELDHIVEWTKPEQRPTWMSLEEYKTIPDTLRVREFVIDIESRDGGRESVVIVSTMTDETIPQRELADLYVSRWNCELDLRSIKQSMHLDVVRAKTPEMVIKDIHAHLLASNLLRGVMTASAKLAGVMPRQLSVKGTMQSVESFTPAMMMTESSEVLYNAFLTTVSAHRVANRPGRQEPRLKKRRPAWREYMTEPRSKSHRKLAKDAR
jgi:hypothetical protein